VALEDPRLWRRDPFWAPLLPWSRIRVLLLVATQCSPGFPAPAPPIQTLEHSRRYNGRSGVSAHVSRLHGIRYRPVCSGT
jgi:hypothetical protein